MAKSKIMQVSRRREFDNIRKLSPAERLQLACELSDLCRALGKAGEKARHGTGQKP